jgi:hypothetical protein
VKRKKKKMKNDYDPIYGDGYSKDPPGRDEEDPDLKEEVLWHFWKSKTPPSAIVTDPKFRKEYEEYLKKHPQVEEDDGQEKP